VEKKAARNPQAGFSTALEMTDLIFISGSAKSGSPKATGAAIL
jgi:hypothetical protein